MFGRKHQPAGFYAGMDSDGVDPNDIPFTMDRAGLGFRYIKSIYDDYRQKQASTNAQCSVCHGSYGSVDYTARGGCPLQFTVDHIKSVYWWRQQQHNVFHPDQAKAWFNDTSNWQPAHWSCNSKKGAD